MDEIADILAEAITARGTRNLSFSQMIRTLEAGHAAGLLLFSVDVTTEDQARPLPEWMFRITDQELLADPPFQLIPEAIAFYRQHSSDPCLQSAWFQVYLEAPE